MRNEQKTLFVGNLPFKVTDQELRELFGTYGSISTVKIPTDRETGRTRGFAFVEFELQEAAQKALALNGQEFQARTLRVNMSHGKPQGNGDRRF